MKGQTNFIFILGAFFAISIFIIFLGGFSNIANSISGNISDSLYASYFKIIPPILFLLVLFAFVTMSR